MRAAAAVVSVSSQGAGFAPSPAQHKRSQITCRFLTSVPNPWHFGTDSDPWIRTSDKRMQLKILLFFSSVTIKMPTKNKFFRLLLFEGTFLSFFTATVIKKSQNSRNQGFSYFFLLDDGRIRIRIRIRTSD